VANVLGVKVFGRAPALREFDVEESKCFGQRAKRWIRRINREPTLLKESK
jgi:hypothetical protein